MIDEDGYRPNVGIVLCNRDDRVLWAKRAGQDGWQFPQGGVQAAETIELALYRELNEEIGLERAHVELLGRTREWLRYDIPLALRRQGSAFRGQKQIWFLLRLMAADERVRLDNCPRPEFECWRWIEYWRALDEIIEFKREVYRRALIELEPYLKQTSLS